MTVPDIDGLIDARKAMNRAADGGKSHGRRLPPDEIAQLQRAMETAPQVETGG